MNVKHIIDNLIFRFAVLKPLLSNILSAEIKDKNLTFIYPDFMKSFEDIDEMNEQIANYLWEKDHINLECLFKNFSMPHLPHPASSSKHNNKLFLIKLYNNNLFYSIIDKRKLYDFFASGKKECPFVVHVIKVRNRIKIFDLIEEVLIETVPILREEYKYLHPLIVIEKKEFFFYFETLFENIFKNMEANKKIYDLRRFVGSPCYSIIDYFNFFEVDDD